MQSLQSSDHLLNVDLDLEAAVLGSVLATPAKAIDLIRYLPKAGVFYGAGHQHLYSAIADLHSQGQEVDLLAIKQLLRQRGQSTEELLTIAEKGSYFDLAPKCLYLHELAIKRYLGQYAQRMLRKANDPTVDVLDLLGKVNTDLETVLGSVSGLRQMKLADHLRQLVEELYQKANREEAHSGLLTGIDALDRRTNGLKPGGFYVLAAGTGVGKTAVAGHIALHQLLAGGGVGLFTLEMKGKEVLSRFVAALTGYSNHQLDKGKGLDSGRIQEAITQLSSIPMQIWDKPIELTQLRYQAAEWCRRYNIRLLIIDYLQLVKHSRAKGRYEQVSEISTTCKEIAQELDVAVLALSQLNRDHEKRQDWDKRPQLSDLRESGQIGQDSDGVMMLFRPHRYGLTYDNGVKVGEQVLEIHLPKWRNGVPTLETDPLLAYYDAATNRIGSIPFPEVPF